MSLRAHAVKSKVTLVARDAGDPLAGATITVAGRHLKTDAKGQATLTLRTGTYPARASAPGYAAAIGAGHGQGGLARRRPIALPRVERAGELRPRADAELAVRTGQVRLDRLARKKDLVRDLLVRQPVGSQPCDAQLGLAQVARRLPDRDPAELCRRPLDPGLGAECSERSRRRVQRFTRRALLLQPPPNLPLREQRPRALERHR